MLLVGGLFLAWTSRGLTFVADEWEFIAFRLTTSNVREAFLLPYIQHFLAFDVAAYKIVFAAAGLRHYWPYQLVALLGHLLTVILLFELARRRIGARLGFFTVLPVVVLGSAWETLNYPFNEQWIYSVATMLAVILLLDWKDRRGDVAIFVLLLVSIASSTFGPVVAAGVLVRLLWEQDRWRRVWVTVVPLALYGLWYMNYGVNAPGPPGYRVTASPIYLLDTAAGSVAALLGVPLGGKTVANHPILALPFQLLTLGLVLALIVRKPRLTPNLTMLLTMLGLYWLVLTLGRGFQHVPYLSRYMYISVILIIVVGLELYRGQQFSSTIRYSVMLAACVATVFNAALLVRYSNVRRRDAAITLAELGAMQIARGPSLYPTFQIDTVRTRIPLDAGQYFSAIDKLHSTPAPSPAGILAEPEAARAVADSELVRAYDLHLIPLTPAVGRLLGAAYPNGLPIAVEAWTDGSVSRIGRCVRLRPSHGRPATLELAVAGGGATVESSSGSATVRVRRFARAFTAALLGTVTGKAWIPLPRGNAPQPWHVQLTASVPIQAC